MKIPRTIPLLYILFFVFAVFALTVSAGEPKRYEFMEYRMAIPVRIVLYADSKENAEKTAAEVYDIFGKLNGIMSDYDPESELMLLCSNADKYEEPHWQRVSGELFAVLKASKHYWKISDGAFDATVGPIVKTWRRARRLHRLPQKEVIETAMRKCGSEFMELDEKTESVRLKKKFMRIDLGGIAKGYALDRGMEAIKRNGISVAMIDAGGDVILGDPPPAREDQDRSGWIIGVTVSREKEAEQVRLCLSNCSVTSSGDTFQYVELDGKRYSHIVDPRTGYALAESSIVTIIGKNGAMESDSLASACSVLEVDAAVKLINSISETEILIVPPPGNAVRRSKGWEQLERNSTVKETQKEK